MPKDKWRALLPLVAAFCPRAGQPPADSGWEGARSLLNWEFISGLDAVVDLISTAQVLLSYEEYLSKLKYQLLKGLLMSLVHVGSVYTQQCCS